MAIRLEPFYRELGRRIREKRMKKEMTQEDLGKLLDPQVTRASIANIEMGTQRVLAHSLAQLAAHLGMTLEELIPPMRAEPANHDEGPSIVKELNKELKIPAKRAEQIVRRLAGGAGRTGRL